MDGASERASSEELDPARVADFLGYLEHLLALPSFAARRRGKLLRYLVEQKLAGRAGQVNEYGIALDVFERPASFDPRTESTVRAEMSRLRRTLADHYEGPGAADAWQVLLPARGHVPIIQARDQPAAETPKAPAPKAAAPRSRLVPGLALALAVAAVTILLVAEMVRYWHPAAPFRSVVVLPFANLTGDSHNEYLADGVTEQLTDALAQIPSLRVVARTSAFQFKGKGVDIREIGRRVGADAVIEGSLQLLNGKLRLTAQVNRSADGYHILSRRFEGAMQELGRLESEMVPPVVATLRPGTPVARRRTPDPQAYDLYLQARAYRARGTREAFDQAVAYLNRAIEHDPNYADAFAGLAGVYASAAVNFATEPLEYASEAKANAAIALRLDPLCSRAEAAQGFVDSMVFLDWSKGERELRRAVALMPQSAPNHNWLGTILLAQGRFPEAIAEQQTGESLDPLVPAVGSAFAYYLARRYDDALERFLKARDLNPDVIAIHPFIGAVLQEKGQFDKAMAEYQLALSKIPDQVNPRIALLLATMGKRDEARKMLASLEHPKVGESPASAFDLAAIYGALGDRDTAFQWLDRAYERRIVWPLKVHPVMDPLRGDPRYAQLLKKTGLAD